MTRYLSVCSGIEAASVAWHPLGWQPIAFSEIDPFACAVLAHHYPEITNLGDMRMLAVRVFFDLVEAPDVLVGGTPCQAFSIAGLRHSLADHRGNLTLNFVELANAIDVARRRERRPACVIVWENVPGVLSTKDNAFGCLLAGLAGENAPLRPPGKRWASTGCVYGSKRAIAWRTLDAQYFGLAQRRRRVFLVASARNGIDPAQILFEWKGGRRDSAPRREAGQKPTPIIAARTRSGSGFGTDFDIDGGLIAKTLLAKGNLSLDPTLDSYVTHSNTCPTRRAGGNRTGGDQPPGTDVDTADSLIVTHSLRGEGFDASEDGSGRGTPLVPTAFDPTQITSRNNHSNPQPGDPCHTLAKNSTAPCIAFNGRMDPVHGPVTGAIDTDPMTQCISVALRARDGGTAAEIGDDKAHALRAPQGGDDKPFVLDTMAVRRLTPRECERLQGFPDDYTLVPVRGKLAADGPRYKALGNSMAVNVMQWIGRRIDNALQPGR